VAWTEEDRRLRRHKNSSGDQRNEFERDRDRLLYSSAFQRLAGITQIVRAGEADVFHTRQQHTIKVAQIGRRLAQHLLRTQPDEAATHGLDPEVVEAACMAHDIGHPPFGHVGEHTLDALVRDKSNTDGFEGNAQSFRIVTKLSVRFPDFPGMDLTRATLCAILKYPWFHSATGKGSKKWSAYQSEQQDFEFARQFFASERRSLEAELMNWSDDVAYSVHDLEDFHRCNAIPWQRIFDNGSVIIDNAAKSFEDIEAAKERLTAAYERLMTYLEGGFSSLLLSPYEGRAEQREQTRRLTSNLINKFINGVKISGAAFDHDAVVFDQEIKDEIEVLKQITKDYVISSAPLAAQQHGQRKIIEDLFGAIISEIGAHGQVPSFLPVRLRYLRDHSPTDNARFVCDCIASLSESETVALHGRLFGISAGSVLDPIVR
jgi:dGTPase